jgi:dienelactone hydrolase
MDVRHVETRVHGRFLIEPGHPERLLVGFHGFAETAEASLEEMKKIPGVEEWTIAAVQALHPFYTGIGRIVACWMTSLDRELAVEDNVGYVRAVLATLPRPKQLVFLGFSQGVAMAFRAAADAGDAASGVIALGGDIPPEIVKEGRRLPPVLLARGVRDDWYTDEKFRNDLNNLADAETCVFDGGHEWTDEFRAAAGGFLRRLVL